MPSSMYRYFSTASRKYWKPAVMFSIISFILWAHFSASLCRVAIAASDKYINYTTVTGYFLQDEPSTNVTTFNFMTANFGLINRTYTGNHTLHQNQTQWQRFQQQVSDLNHAASPDVEYKLLFMGRHGDGYHNDAQAFYGTPAWNCYYSIRDGNATVTWSDAHLLPLGVTQALAVNSFWRTEIETQKIPTPQSYYTSPLTRCLQTANYTFNGLDLPTRYPFIPEVKELFREGISGHTCDRRGSKTYIHDSFPSYKIEPDFTENDQLWEALHGETTIDQAIRSKTVLDQVFKTDRNTYISITSHSGEIASILSVLGHRTFSLSTGAVIPVLVKAQTIGGSTPSTSEQPFTPICTCTTPPAVTATTSDCSYPTPT
ncbi:putative phosphoglycerate mutase pmu1 [Lecanora helva]